MKTTMKEREILAAIKRQVSNLEKKLNRKEGVIIVKESNDYTAKFPVKLSTCGVNNIAFPVNHPLCVITLEANTIGEVYYRADIDAGFDMLPKAMKEFVFEYELEFANMKTNVRAIENLKDIDNTLVEKYGKEYVLRRLKWLHKYCGHILRKDKLAKRIENIEFYTI